MFRSLSDEMDSTDLSAHSITLPSSVTSCENSNEPMASGYMNALWNSDSVPLIRPSEANSTGLLFLTSRELQGKVEALFLSNSWNSVGIFQERGQSLNQWAK